MTDTPEEEAPSSPTFNPHAELPHDFEKQLLKKLIARLLHHLDDPEYDIPVAEMTLIRQLCADNSISFSSIRKGDFGKVAQRVAEEFPFDDEGRVVPIAGGR